jgi:hypothetical protein
MPAQRNITLTVPKDFDIPDFFLKASAERIALALNLGSEAVEYIEKHAMDAVREETHDEAVKEASKEHDRTVVALTTKLKKAEEAARAATLRIEAMDADAASLRSQIQKEVTSTFDAILKSKDQQLANAKETLDKAMDSVGKRVESLQNTMTKTFSSSKEKGSLGEAIMETFLKKAYDCNIDVISKERESADIRMMRNKTDYLWEVKNYTRAVSAEEIEKLRRDLRLHPDVRGGILVSLRQGIVGKSRGGDIDLEFLEDGRFILFISNFMAQEDPVFYLQTLRPFFDMIESTVKPVKDDSDAVRSLEMKATIMTNLLRNHHTSVTKHKNSLFGHKKRMDTMFAEFQAYILEADSNIRTILRVAMGGEETSAEIKAETDTTLAPLFKKRCLAEYADSKTRDFVKWLLVEAEADSSSQIEIKDLIERGKSNYSEKFIRGLREEVFEDAAWVKGSRFIVGLRWVSL